MITHDTVIGKKKASKSFIPQSGLSFIEQLQIVQSKPCTKTNTPLITGLNAHEEILVHFKANCKQWDCETCGARNAKTWIAKIINGVNRIGGEWSFLTITAHRKTRGIFSVRNLRDGWKKFYNRILSNIGKNAETLYFAKVWEQHKSGSFHLHILINICLGKRWAKDNAVGTGMGHQADWHQVDNAGQVAGYVAKYTLKNSTLEQGGIIWPKGLRRIETSRNWPKLSPKMKDENWAWIVYQSREFQLHQAKPYQQIGFTIIDKVKE